METISLQTTTISSSDEDDLEVMEILGNSEQETHDIDSPDLMNMIKDWEEGSVSNDEKKPNQNDNGL